ncbi:unnamed protein product [Adineta ricciae]|uniref:G-protein coupled receptors family 1 profile domain-containing protein n=1 Tax=Adineta ricciae TaxID=249248 RepID=A0A815AD09_ADIRI|nr:unnamed protein product [Adineta ricciae]
MSSSNTSSVDIVNEIRRQLVVFVRCWSAILFTLGLVGHILNIYVFTRPILYSNSCGRYFFASTITGLLVVIEYLLIRALQLGYSIDLMSTSIVVCKILAFSFIPIRTLPSWFIALACLDRYLCSSTSTNLRQWCNTRNATRIIWIVVLFMGVINSHMFGFYTIIQAEQICDATPTSYVLFYGIWNLIIWTVIPIPCMIIFTLLTVRNIHRAKNRIGTDDTQNDRQHIQWKKERQLIRMTIGQAFLLGLPSAVNSITHLYIAPAGIIMANNDIEEATITNAYHIIGFVSLFGPSMSFYLFTLSSKLFRKQLILLFRCGLPEQTQSQLNRSIQNQ